MAIGVFFYELLDSRKNVLTKLENELRLHHVTKMHLCQCWRANWKSGLKTDLVVAGFKSQKLSSLLLKSSWLCFQLSNLRHPNEFRQHEHNHTQTAKHPDLHPTLERHRGENYILVECFFFFMNHLSPFDATSRCGAAEVHVTEQREWDVPSVTGTRTARIGFALFQVFGVCVYSKETNDKRRRSKSEDERCCRV